jgi:hypothetical protein
MDYLKNPLIIGLIAATITYLYLYWEADKKHKKNPKSKKIPVSLITPGIVGVIVWFIASTYLTSKPKSSSMTSHQNFRSKPSIVHNYKLVNSVSDGSSGSGSYHLIGKNNVKLPPTDVFIDLARF